MSVEEYRARAEALLRLAAQTDNLRDRGKLIDEATVWYNRTLDDHEGDDGPINDNYDDPSPSA